MAASLLRLMLKLSSELGSIKKISFSGALEWEIAAFENVLDVALPLELFRVMVAVDKAIVLLLEGGLLATLLLFALQEELAPFIKLITS